LQGIELARTKGVKFGRRNALTGEQDEQLRQQRTDGKKIVDQGLMGILVVNARQPISTQK
jgi:hypothetical protein